MGDLSSVYYKMTCHDTHMIVHSRIYIYIYIYIYIQCIYIYIYLVLHTGKKYDRMWLMIIVHDTY